MPRGQVKNHSSRTLWVIETDSGPAIAHKLAPGMQSPTSVDADGFKSVDGTPVDGYTSWVKIIDLSTADVADSGDALTRGCILCYNVPENQFGIVTYDNTAGWGEPLLRGTNANGPTLTRGAIGLALNIGLNHVDPDHYDGWDGQLRAAENDARDMQSIGQACGYRTKILLSEDATSARVLKELAAAAQRLVPGDIFLLTYAGHGSQIQDVNGDEDDGLDETWLLFDRMLVDDELYSSWARFKPGVRIVMVSDSCHSGSMARAPIYKAIATTPVLRRAYGVIEQPVFRVAPDDVAKATYENHKDLYDAVQWSCLEGDRASVAASVLLMSGCQDNETSSDGPSNGLFTGKLKQVWNDGKFKGSYFEFLRQIRRLMPKTQTPNYFTVGRSDKAFEDSQPFSIKMISGSQQERRDWDMPQIGNNMLPKHKTSPHSVDPWDTPLIGEEMFGKNHIREGDEDISDTTDLVDFKTALHDAIDEVVSKYRDG